MPWDGFRHQDFMVSLQTRGSCGKGTIILLAVKCYSCKRTKDSTEVEVFPYLGNNLLIDTVPSLSLSRPRVRLPSYM